MDDDATAVVARFFGPSRWRRYLCLGGLALATLVLANVVVRTTQYFRSAVSTPHQSPNQCVEALSMAAPEVARQLNASVPLDQVIDPTNDNDNDGLDPLAEFLQFTSDDNTDCDNDGALDGVDGCPNCWGNDYRARVEASLIRGLLRDADGPSEFTVYVPVPWGRSLNLPEGPYRVVASPEWHFRLVQRHFGQVPPSGISWLYLEPEIILPGAFYVYRTKMMCGKRCGWTRLSMLIDIPILGPTYIGSRLLWIA